jgi:hypothetical protein
MRRGRRGLGVVPQDVGGVWHGPLVGVLVLSIVMLTYETNDYADYVKLVVYESLPYFALAFGWKVWDGLIGLWDNVKG